MKTIVMRLNGVEAAMLSDLLKRGRYRTPEELLLDLIKSRYQEKR